jgi:DGQHR domain-containing protein
MKEILRVPALEVRQGERFLYSFAIDGKVAHKIAAVSRIRRSDKGALGGYQRPEVLRHIAEIRDYIESDAPMIPNAVVIAFDSRVKFVPTTKGARHTYARTGELVIPFDNDSRKNDRPGFIVDGQQRLAAVRDAKVKSFPICVSAFITDDIAEQTEQFILVNSTKPLPKGLIYELLPGTDATLPTHLARKRVPATILTHLNRDAVSPLLGMIQTPTNPEGVIKDNSILKMLEHSLSDGLLYRVRQGMGKRLDVEPMVDAVSLYWSAVRETFPAAWGLPPRKSRLLHGVGIVCLGFLMDAIADRHREKSVPSKVQFANDLEAVAPVCHWNSGHWNFGRGDRRRWDEIQNTPQDVQLVSRFLLGEYKERTAKPRGRQASSRNYSN